MGSHDLAIFDNNLQIQIFVRFRCMVTPPRSQHLWNSSALEVEVESRRAELQCGRSEGCKGSLVPWPLEEIITAELLFCQKKCMRRSAANTHKGRSFMLRDGVNEQVCVHGKWHCFVENLFPGIDNVLIDQFAVVYFCVSGEEKLLVVCYEDISCTKTAQ